MENLDFLTQIVNYGAIGICLGYFIYKDFRNQKFYQDTMIEFKKAITEMKEVLVLVKEKVS